MKSIILTTILFFVLAAFCRANFEDTRCRCTCPSTEFFSSRNKTVGAANNRRYYTKTNLNSANCNTQTVVKQAVIGEVDDGRLDAFLANCNCKFESRNSLLLKVVVIFVICVLLSLSSYMAYLLVVDPLLRRHQQSAFIPYQRHSGGGSAGGGDDMEENIFADPPTAEDSSDLGDTSGGELQMRTRHGHSISGGVGVLGKVADRVAAEQHKWKSHVEEQRRHVMNHQMLN